MTSFNKLTRRDDLLLDRLVFFMRRKAGLHVYDVIPIKKNMYLLYTGNGVKVLKGYVHLPHLKAIHCALSAVIGEGFKQAVQYEHYPNGELVIFFGGMYWAVMPYLSSVSRFSYETFARREQVISLLKAFHQCGEAALPNAECLLPRMNLTERWETRLRQFQKNHEELSRHISENIQWKIVVWAEISLDLFKRFWQPSHSRLCILHGDVASHNVIQSYDGSLWLIDFDLLSVGIKEYEYMQLMHRFLRYTKWSLSALEQHAFIQELLNAKWLMCLLLFPSDILREWNKMCSRPSHQRANGQLKTLIDATIEEVYYRQSLVGEIIGRLD